MEIVLVLVGLLTSCLAGGFLLGSTIHHFEEKKFGDSTHKYHFWPNGR